MGLHILSDALIALAYYSIPLTLFYFVRKRRDLPFTWVFLLFSAFIIACGTTHLMEIWTLWHPVYWLSGAIKLITAATSLTTAVLLGTIVPQALALPSPAQLEAANQALQSEIIDRKQTELALARLAAIVESSSDAIIGKSLDGMITSWNASAEKLFGYTAEDVLGHSIAILFPPDRTDELAHILEHVQHGETIERYETVRVRNDGQYITIAATISPIKDANGQVIGASKIARDISERKHIEAALRQSEERLQLALEASGDGLWDWNIQAGEIYYNTQFFELLGYAADELPQTTSTWERLVHPDDMVGVQALLAAHLKDTAVPFRFDYRLQTKTGAWKWIADYGKVVARDRQGKPLRMIGTHHDIDDRKRAEQALQEREAFLRAIGDNIPNGYLYQLLREQDGSYRYTYVSAGIERASGLKPEVVLADSSSMFKLLVEEDLPYVLQKGEESAQNLSIFNVQVRERLANGEIRWLQLCATPRRLEDGCILWDGIRLDINDLKQTEEALRRYERIVSATTDAISLLDRNYVYQVVNQSYLHWYNKPQEDVVGHPVSELLPTDVYETTVKPRLDQCLAGQGVQYETWANYTTPEPQFLSVTYDPYFDSNQTLSGVVVSLRNLTRLKQAEVELELQSLIVSNIAEGVCLVKVSDGRFVYANPKFEQMFGYEPNELVGQHVSIVNYEDNDTNTTAVYEKLAQVILARGDAIYEVHNVKKDGTTFWCQATTSIFEHPTYGAVFVVVQQNITERKQAEAVIQDSLKEKEVLLKEIHHRVKNNLGVVDGLLDMQSRRSQNPDVVETLRESQNRIASIALVHEKLYGSKNLGAIDFTQYMADLTAHLFNSYNIQPNQVQLTTQIAQLTLDIDTAIPCGLMINELVSNALKYAFPGGRSGEIHVTLQQQQGHSFVLIVRDNGVGLPEDFNLKQTQTLGMTLVKGLVKQLRGTFEFQAQPGATFVITLCKP